MRGPVVATIDIGTNAVLMLVAAGDSRTASVHRLADRERVTGLGRNVDRAGVLGAEAISRTLAALHAHVEEARALGATTFRAVGTSALRDAHNRDDFLVPAAQILGGPVEVISGAREAELTYRGALVDLELGDGELTVIDIGGGSTELIRRDRNGVRFDVCSLDIGSVRLHERFLASDPPTSVETEALVACVKDALAKAAVQPVAPLVGIAGTWRTLLTLARPDELSAHGAALHTREVADVTRSLSSMPLEARRSLAGLSPLRADVIVAGSLLVKTILEAVGATQAVVSHGGVRTGLALELLFGPETH